MWPTGGPQSRNLKFCVPLFLNDPAKICLPNLLFLLPTSLSLIQNDISSPCLGNFHAYVNLPCACIKIWFSPVNLLLCLNSLNSQDQRGKGRVPPNSTICPLVPQKTWGCFQRDGWNKIEVSINRNKLSEKKVHKMKSSPGRVAQLIGALSCHQKVSGWIPGQVTCTGSNWTMFLSPVDWFLPSPRLPSLSLKSINIFLGEDQKNKIKTREEKHVYAGDKIPYIFYIIKILDLELLFGTGKHQAFFWTTPVSLSDPPWGYFPGAPSSFTRIDFSRACLTKFA